MMDHSVLHEKLTKGNDLLVNKFGSVECLKCHNKHLGKSQLHAEYKPTALSILKPSKVSLHT